LFFCYLFLNALLSFKGVGRQIFWEGEGGGQKEHQDREIASVSSLRLTVAG